MCFLLTGESAEGKRKNDNPQSMSLTGETAVCANKNVLKHLNQVSGVEFCFARTWIFISWQIQSFANNVVLFVVEWGGAGGEQGNPHTVRQTWQSGCQMVSLHSPGPFSLQRSSPAVRSGCVDWLVSIGDCVECDQASCDGEKKSLFLKAYSGPKQTHASCVLVMMKVLWMDP